MQRLVVVSVLVSASIVSPVGVAVASPAAGHDAAAAQLRADFNNDGAEDLAIGVPGETVGTAFSAGAVNVLYGSIGGGLTAAGSQLFTQDTPGVGSTAEELDRFGETLASGDFNNDGFTDLAVGAPSETVGAVEEAGAVNVMFGSASGLTGTGSQLFTQDSPGVGSSVEPTDSFGLALAAGDFNNSGTDDLAVGAAAESVGTVQFAGAVNVLYGRPVSGLTGANSQLFTQDSPGVGSTAEPSDQFGQTLAAGDFNNSGTEDLAAGAAFESVGVVEAAGAVNVLYGRPVTGLTGANSQLFTQDSPGVGSTAEEVDAFGLLLAGGDFDANGADDLAVGVPFESVGTVLQAGAVNVLYGSTSRLTGTGSQLFTQDTPGVEDTVERPDVFGFALAGGDFDADNADDLAIGAPGESLGTVLQAGAVNVFHGSTNRLSGTESQLFTQDTPGVEDTAEEFDFFGGALDASSEEAVGGASGAARADR
jgi:hypothetical protein